MKYATMDLGFICRVGDTESAKIARSEVRRLLTIPLAEVDVARFGFASIGKIVAHYQTTVAAESP